MAVFEENPAHFDFEEYMTGPPNIITSIKLWVKHLAMQADLLKLDKLFK